MRYKPKMFKYLSLTFIGLSLIAPSSQAQDTIAASSVSTPAPYDPSKAFLDLRYEAWASGPTFRAMDGREFGPGPKVSIEHTVRPGYYMGNGWKTRALLNATQRILPDKSGKKSWEYTDPALGMQKTRILQVEKHGVDWRLEGYYFFPISKGTKENIGTNNDHGNGTIRVQSRVDSGLLGNTPIWMSARWNGLSFLKDDPGKANLDYYFQMFNKLGYAVTEKFSPYIAYNNYFDWYRNGQKDAWHKNQAAEAGFFYNFTPDTYLNLFFESPFHLKDTQIWVGFETWVI